MAESRDEIKFDIKKAIGVIGDGTRGWRKEINIISWNGRPPKIDIRDWNETHEKMGKGVTLTGAEVRAMMALLQKIDLDALED